MKKKQDYDIQRKYYNKEACAHCKYSKECCTTKYRSVSISGGILALKMILKFEEYEEKINLDSLAYNLIRLYNQFMELVGINESNNSRNC